MLVLFSELWKVSRGSVEAGRQQEQSRGGFPAFRISWRCEPDVGARGIVWRAVTILHIHTHTHIQTTMTAASDWLQGQCPRSLCTHPHTHTHTSGATVYNCLTHTCNERCRRSQPAHLTKICTNSKLFRYHKYTSYETLMRSALSHTHINIMFLRASLITAGQSQVVKSLVQCCRSHRDTGHHLLLSDTKC